jgi:hypothetical protein
MRVISATESRRCTSFQFAFLLVLVAMCACTPTYLRKFGETAKPPALLSTAGGFSVAEVSYEPFIDGQEWIAANVQTTSDAGPVPLATQEFSLTATNCGDVGDFARCQVLFQRGRALAVGIDRGFTGWVYVTPDARFIFTEPLYVLDVRRWEQYALSDVLRIQSYVSIKAISADDRRLFISRSDCPYDCRHEPRHQYYELTLPK